MLAKKKAAKFLLVQKVIYHFPFFLCIFLHYRRVGNEEMNSDLEERETALKGKRNLFRYGSREYFDEIIFHCSFGTLRTGDFKFYNSRAVIFYHRCFSFYIYIYV